MDLPGAAGPWHDTAGARAHDGLLDTLPEWTDPWHAVGADLGYAAENTRLTCPIKTPRGGELTTDPHTVNTLHAAALVLLHH